jgi:flagellar biogenesis protein FliO
MPSTARIAFLILSILLPVNLRAEINVVQPKNKLLSEETEAQPSWVAPLPAPLSKTVPPPLTAPEKTAPTPLPARESRIPLSPAGKTASTDSTAKTDGLPSMVTVAGSLGVVLGAFLLFVYVIRRAGPRGLSRLPNEAFEVLGRAPLAGRQNVHLIRCGNKLLLVSVTPAGTETLTEITDPQEVDRLAGLCLQSNPRSSTTAFRQIFEQLAPKRPTRGAFSQNDFADFGQSGIELPDAMDWGHHDA